MVVSTNVLSLMHGLARWVVLPVRAEHHLWDTAELIERALALLTVVALLGNEIRESRGNALALFGSPHANPSRGFFGKRNRYVLHNTRIGKHDVRVTCAVALNPRSRPFVAAWITIPGVVFLKREVT